MKSDISGHTQIKKLTVELSTVSEIYVMEDYDGGFLWFDCFYDNLNNRHILLLAFDRFNGMGGCDIFVVTVQDGIIHADNVEDNLDKGQLYADVKWTENRTAAITNKNGVLIAEIPVELTDDGFIYDSEDSYKTAVAGVDSVINYELVSYQGQTRLVIYQDVYGTCRADVIACILSLVDISGEVYTLDKQWVIPVA